MFLFQIEDLEKQLHLAHSKTAEAQTEQDQRSQESGNLNEQIQQLLVRNDSIEKIMLSKSLALLLMFRFAHCLFPKGSIPYN